MSKCCDWMNQRRRNIWSCDHRTDAKTVHMHFCIPVKQTFTRRNRIHTTVWPLGLVLWQESGTLAPRPRQITSVTTSRNYISGIQTALNMMPLIRFTVRSNLWNPVGDEHLEASFIIANIGQHYLAVGPKLRLNHRDFQITSYDLVKLDCHHRCRQLQTGNRDGFQRSHASFGCHQSNM